jgi:2-dehydro-3-deoxyphosphooctonate aldolase (KDO 8-P synthase)
MTRHCVNLPSGIAISNERPFVLFGGMNVIESESLLFEVAEALLDASRHLDNTVIFKASFDKANRSSIHSYRGPGMEAGLAMLRNLKDRLAVPILTDVHETWQAEPVAEVADIVQIPAFLARQTDLVTAIARTGAVINVKKPQYLAPAEMRHILEKCSEAGNENILICERGTSFGYNNLIVDMLGIDQIKGLAPVIFDVTHSLQQPGARSDSAGGRGPQAPALMRAALAVGIAGLFVEIHPNPKAARCDGPSALALEDLHDFLKQAKAVDGVVKKLLDRGIVEVSS